jgi:hypothetical protein
VHTGDEGAPNVGDGATAEDFKATTLRKGERGAGACTVRKGRERAKQALSLGSYRGKGRRGSDNQGRRGH